MRTSHVRRIWRGILFYIAWVFVVLCVVSGGCVHPGNLPDIPSRELVGATSLTLAAFPPMSVHPRMVSLTGFVKGVEDPSWDCPLERWDYGDGESSSHFSECDPYMGKIPRVYHTVHAYKWEGTFHPVLSLWKGEKRLSLALTTVYIGTPK